MCPKYKKHRKVSKRAIVRICRACKKCAAGKRHSVSRVNPKTGKRYYLKKVPKKGRRQTYVGTRCYPKHHKHTKKAKPGVPSMVTLSSGRRSFYGGVRRVPLPAAFRGIRAW